MKSFREYLTESEDDERYTLFDPKILAQVMKILRKNPDSDPNIVPDFELREYPNWALKKSRQVLPRLYKGMPDVDKIQYQYDQIFIEQKYRQLEKEQNRTGDLKARQAKAEQDGKWPETGKPFPKLGDKVEKFVPFMLGFGGVTLEGIVKKKAGLYYVSTTNPHNGKRATSALTYDWWPAGTKR